MSMPAACCDTPSIKDAQWHNKGEFTTLSKEVAGEKIKTYVTGPKDSKHGLIAIYDIFGYHPTGLQFFDRIAESHGGFRLIAPNFFGKVGGIDDTTLGGGRPKVVAWIDAHGDYKQNHVDETIRVAVEDLRKTGCTSFSIFGQCWGAFMSVKAGSEEGSPFLAIGGVHPALINVDNVKDVKAPLILLPARDDDDMIPLIESVKGKNFAIESFHHRFESVHHGWTGARGDWTQVEQYKAGLEAVDQLGAYFAKVAAHAVSKQ
ncbi:hypothetical protein EC968_003387 [Mortierella alpina]|nr:hypothetical protein EC968_003387 [Mortierella alpina]